MGVGGGEGVGGVVFSGDRGGGGGECGLYGRPSGLLGGGGGAGEGEAAGTSRLGRLAAGAVVAAAAASGPPFQMGRLGGCWFGGVEGASWVAGGGASSARAWHPADACSAQPCQLASPIHFSRLAWHPADAC